MQQRAIMHRRGVISRGHDTRCIMCTLSGGDIDVFGDTRASKVSFSTMKQIYINILTGSRNIRYIINKMCVLTVYKLVLEKRRTNIVFVFTKYLRT